MSAGYQNTMMPSVSLLAAELIFFNSITASSEMLGVPLLPHRGLLFFLIAHIFFALHMFMLL
jgi:hypothetical protein